ncbi:aminotransferase A [Sediminibacillus albus]|uniref:Aminotransferase n=1 Tax=Sediminibacillus albus TaxID=407036 RepID=A0A1G8WC94_9BACI|nr:aminotransferase A [Sediminibacillus albus]SDJ75878.1 aminotransferase [Sediminibacillus albus]
MEHLLNDQVKSLQISGIRKFFNMVANKQDIISLTIGQPDFPTPENVKNAGKTAIDQNHTTYTHNAGMFPLRQAIADFVSEKYHLSYNPDDEIIVTVGASQAIDITLRTIIQPGDEVILPSPVYPGYEPLIKLAGGVPVHADTRDTNFKLTGDLIKSHISKKTKCVIIPYPSNPTGMTLSHAEIEDIADLLENKEIFILADEIYSELVYEQDHTSIASFKKMRDKTIVINGLSKSHSMTGWRIGYLLCPDWLGAHILKVHQYNVSCATSISQHAALSALTSDKLAPIKMKNQYKKRRDYVYQRLTDMGLDILKPDGAFYFFIKLEVDGLSSFELAIKLVEEAKLALVPGDAFSEGGKGYLRLSYAYDFKTIETALERLETFLKNNQ